MKISSSAGIKCMYLYKNGGWVPLIRGPYHSYTSEDVLSYFGKHGTPVAVEYNRMMTTVRAVKRIAKPLDIKVLIAPEPGEAASKRREAEYAHVF